MIIIIIIIIMNNDTSKATFIISFATFLQIC
jgi:hypothetical protein